MTVGPFATLREVIKRIIAQTVTLSANLPGGVTWTDMPAAETDFLGNSRTQLRIDLTNARQVRLSARVVTAGAVGATLLLQYSTDGTTYAATGATVALQPSGDKAGVWADLPAAAKADVWIRLRGSGGDGAADPNFGLITFQVR